MECTSHFKVCNADALTQGPPPPFITLFSHVGGFHDPGMCQLYFVGSLNKDYLFIIHTYLLELKEETLDLTFYSISLNLT